MQREVKQRPVAVVTVYLFPRAHFCAHVFCLFLHLNEVFVYFLTFPSDRLTDGQRLRRRAGGDDDQVRSVG